MAEKTNKMCIRLLQLKNVLSFHCTAFGAASVTFRNYITSELSSFQPGREHFRRVNIFPALMIIFLVTLLYHRYPILNELDRRGVSLA